MMKIMIQAYHIEVICVKSVGNLGTTAVREEGIIRVWHRGNSSMNWVAIDCVMAKVNSLRASYPESCELNIDVNARAYSN